MQRYPELRNVAASSSSTTRNASLASLLSVSVSNLDAEAEMRYNCTIVRDHLWWLQKTERCYSYYPDPVFTAHKTATLMEHGEGLSSIPLTDEEVADRNSPAALDKWWSIEYSKRYKGVTKTFMQAVMTGGSI